MPRKLTMDMPPLSAAELTRGGFAGQLATRLRRVRAVHGWTVRQVAARSGLGHGYLTMVETARRIFTPDRLSGVARGYELPPAELALLCAHEAIHRHIHEEPSYGSLGLHAPGYRLYIQRPDGSTLSWQDLGTGEIGVDLRPEEEALVVTSDERTEDV